MATISGTPGNDTINANGDTVDISQGGEDTVNNAGNIIAGGALDAGDVINGAGLINISLDGDYSSGLAFDNSLLPQLELHSITLGGGYSYDLVFGRYEFTNAYSLAPIAIDASALGAGDNFTLDLTAGSFVGGMGPDPNNFLIKNGAGTETVLFHGDAKDASVSFDTPVGAGLPTEMAISDDTYSRVVEAGGVKLQFQDGLAILGTDGDDNLSPVAGAAAYFAGAGNDTITTGTGTVFVDGGAGSDTVALPGNRADYTAGYDAKGRFTLTDGASVVTLANVEFANFADQRLILGTSGADTLSGTTSGESFFGGQGNDAITGAGPADTALYTGAQAQYGITRRSDGTYQVVDQRSGSPDGTDILSNIGHLSFSDGTIAMPALNPNHPPVVTTANATLTANRTVALSSLFSVSDADNDTITQYQLWDSTRDPDSGHFIVNGVAQNPATIITITAAQLAQTSFVTGTVGDSLQIRAYDGTDWSAGDTAAWSPFQVAIQQTPAPIVTTQNLTEGHNQTLAASSLFSVSDPSGNAITEYQLWESTPDAAAGRFFVNGVAQSTGTAITITAAQLAQTSFVTGSIAAALQIRAYDGTNWSADANADWSPFTVSVGGDQVPVLTTQNLSERPNQTLALSSLFSVSDADGDAIRQYQLWESTRDPNAGHFVVNGVTQQAGTIINVTAAQLAQTSFVTGSVSSALQIRASDGAQWSAADNAAWAPFVISAASNSPPVVTTANLTEAVNQTLSLSSLFSVSDPDGDAITQYQLWESTRDPSAGHFVLNGVTQQAGTIINVSAAQLAQASFVTGSISAALQIRAYDGAAWSAADNASWAPFTISPPADHAPVVTTANVSEPTGQSIALSSLFSVSDTDGDVMTQYQLWEGTRDPNAGHFDINGAAQPAGAAITLTAAQLAQASFVPGTAAASLQIRAFDGQLWSADANADWSPFTVTPTPSANHAPVVTTANVTEAANQSVALSSLFSVSDTDGDAITQYQLWESALSSEGYFSVNGVAQPASTVIDISAAQLAQTSFVTGTQGASLQIRAFDGKTWSASDTAAWAPFHVAVS